MVLSSTFERGVSPFFLWIHRALCARLRRPCVGAPRGAGRGDPSEARQTHKNCRRGAGAQKKARRRRAAPPGGGAERPDPAEGGARAGGTRRPPARATGDAVGGGAERARPPKRAARSAATPKPGRGRAKGRRSGAEGRPRSEAQQPGGRSDEHPERGGKAAGGRERGAERARSAARRARRACAKKRRRRRRRRRSGAGTAPRPRRSAHTTECPDPPIRGRGAAGPRPPPDRSRKAAKGAGEACADRATADAIAKAGAPRTARRNPPSTQARGVRRDQPRLHGRSPGCFMRMPPGNESGRIRV